MDFVLATLYISLLGLAYGGVVTSIVVKRIDSQGRIVLPLSWRRRHNVREVLVVSEEDKLIILPKRPDLTRYFDSIEVDVRSFSDYHELRRELRVKGSEVH